MALYLKYRPQSFADVVGQDHVVTTLEQSVAHGHISHAYLFCGSRGTGKTSVARILAKTILLSGIESGAIREQMTKGIEEGSFVDLIEIDGASNRGIDAVRELIEKINFSPAVAKSKVYIIDEVHMMTKDAFNALLKTLEEPPEYAFFILATTELHKVPDTIQSRCQRFLFRRVRDEDITRRLQFIADQEHIKVEREALRAIAKHALGSFRDGIALLDQLRSLQKITLTDVTERIGKTSMTFMEEIISALSARDMERIKNVVAHIEESNVPIDLIAADLLTLVRTHLHEAIEKKEDPSSFIRMTDVLLEAIKNIRLSPVPALVLESTLLSLCSTTSGAATSERKPAVAAVTLKVIPPAEGTPALKQEATAIEVAPATKGALVEAEELSSASVLKHWPELLEAVTPPSVRMSLKNGTVSSVKSDTLELSFAAAFHRDRIAETNASRTIEDILHRIFRKPIRLKCVLDKDARPAIAGPATDLVEAAAEVFGNM